MESIAEAKGYGEIKEPRRCAKCGKRNKRLVMDTTGLSYEQKKQHRGEWYCNSHLPRHQALPTTSFQDVL
jgi:hypothetical protein